MDQKCGDFLIEKKIPLNPPLSKGDTRNSVKRLKGLKVVRSRGSRYGRRNPPDSPLGIRGLSPLPPLKKGD